MMEQISRTTSARLGTTMSAAADATLLAHAVETAGRHAWLGRALSFPLRHAWLDLEYFGRENVPSEGPVILAANHLAFIDSPLLTYGLDRPVVFVGKAEYLVHPVSRRLFPMTGMLPLDRSGRNSRVTLDRVNEILGDGGIVGVHPEGTRSRDGFLNPAHRGVAQMALRANAPVVPVALIGTGVAQPVGQVVPNFRGRVEVRFGAPIGLGRWGNTQRSAQSRRELTDEVMDSIAALSGQELRADSVAASVHDEEWS